MVMCKELCVEVGNISQFLSKQVEALASCRRRFRGYARVRKRKNSTAR